MAGWLDKLEVKQTQPSYTEAYAGTVLSLAIKLTQSSWAGTRTELEKKKLF